MPDTDKDKFYQQALKEIKSILHEARLDRVGAMATVVAVLHENIPYYDWTGFYRVIAPKLLQIGPYQGHVACLEIPFAKGVCGHSASKERCVIVDDVRKFKGYIACSHTTLSEIVVPVLEKGKLTAILDIDSNQLAAFDATDEKYLTQIISILIDA